MNCRLRLLGDSSSNSTFRGLNKVYQINLTAYKEGHSKEDDGPEAHNKISVQGIFVSLAGRMWVSYMTLSVELFPLFLISDISV